MTTRREFLRLTGLAAGASALYPISAWAETPQLPERVVQFRANAAMTEIKATKLRDNVYLLQGVGGNMVAQFGPDGKLLIDSSALTAAPYVIKALDLLGPQPLKILVNTHWHFDHTDGNAALHDAGATIVAHENTTKRLANSPLMKMFNLQLPPWPSNGLPQQTFSTEKKLSFNGDSVDLVYFRPAHTDTDIYILFEKENVLHTGDIWFNGMYPFFDESTGGNIGGLVTAVEQALKVTDADTKIVPGHGQLGDKAALQSYHDMLATSRDRVHKLKAQGASEQEAQSKKPTSDLDAAWAKGTITPDAFVGLVYRTL